MDPIKVKYDSLIKGGAKAFLAKQYENALKCYSEALELATQIYMGKMIINIIKYMMASCLVESETLDDLAEAVMILETLDLATKKRFPAIFSVLARAHCKLFRFNEGFQAIVQGEEIYRTICKNLLELEVYYIPSTNIVINHDIGSESWEKIKEECSNYYQPDAICYYKECCNITKPYTSPSTNIFYRDPAFNGMVVLKCNNIKRPCTLNYHKYCWKVQKDRLYPAEKISDKDFVGHKCFTENCYNGKNPSIISYIEIIAVNGTSKVHIHALDKKTPWHLKNTDEKVRRNSTSKSDNIHEQSKKSEQDNFRKENHSWEIYQENYAYSEDTIVILNEDFKGKVDFSYEHPEIAEKKEFLLSIFEAYIKKNLVRVCDIYSKYAEYSEYVILPNLDILEFLLSTRKIKILDDMTQIPVFSDEDIYEKDGDDYFYSLMSDVEDCDLEYQNKNKESKLDKYMLEKCASDKAGGDAPPFQKISNKLENNISTDKSKKNTPPDKKEIDDRELKEYITQLESNIKKIKIENENLKKELISKNADLDLLQKQLEDNNVKWKLLEKKIYNFKENHNEVKQENIKLKTEVIELIKSKEELEEKLLEYANPKSRQKELLKNFEEEYQIIEEKLNSEWKTKSENMIKEALNKEVKTRLFLLGKCLNTQYSNIKNTINGHIHICTTILDVIIKINDWMIKTMKLRKFLDNDIWVNLISSYKKALVNAQEEYKTLSNRLHNEESTEKYEIRDINMTIPDLPPQPKETAGDYVLKALNSFYENKHAVFQCFQQPHTYIRPSIYLPQAPYATNYAQISAPPGMVQPMQFPPSEPVSSTAVPNFNAFSHLNVSMAVQYKQMQDQIHQEMQQQLQNLQQEIQQMSKKFELNTQVSYPDSVSSSNKSLNNAVDDSSVQIIPIEQELQALPEFPNQEESDSTYVNNINNKDVKVIYDTGSTTGMCEDCDSVKSIEMYDKQEQIPLKTTAGDLQYLQKDQEESVLLRKSEYLEKDQEEPGPLKNPQYLEENQEESVPFKKSQYLEEDKEEPVPFRKLQYLKEDEEEPGPLRKPQHFEENQEESLPVIKLQYVIEDEEEPGPFIQPQYFEENKEESVPVTQPQYFEENEEESVPLTQPQYLEEDQEKSVPFTQPQYLGDQEESVPLTDNCDNWKSRDAESVPLRRLSNDSQYIGKSQERTVTHKKPSGISQNWKENQSTSASKRSTSRLQHWKEEEEKPLPSRSFKRPVDLQHWEKNLEVLYGNFDAEIIDDTQSLEENSSESHSNSFDHKKPVENVVKTTTKQDDYGDNLVMKYLLQDSSNDFRERRPNLDALVNRLKAKYPGTLESDIIYIISEIRKRHNNSLSGLTVRQILEEAEVHFTNNQHIHLIRYLNGTPKIPAKASGIQNVRKDSSGSTSSYCTASKSSVRSITSKKTWNPILPQEEIKWTPLQEVDCSICSNRVTKNTCYTLNCRHSYHKLCAKSWFKTQRTCPNCRSPVTEDDEFPPLPC